MNGKMLMAFVSLGFAIGCEPSSKTEGKISNATVTKSLGQQIVGFNWSSSDERMDRFLKGAIANAQDSNRKISSVTDIPDGAVAGHGLYLASDPLQSTVYGTELTCVALEPSSSWKDFSFGSSKAADIAGPEAVLRYPFSAGILPLPSSSEDSFEFAAVVRDLNAIDIGKSKKISFQREGRGEGLDQKSLRAAQGALSRKDVCGVLSAFEGEFSTLVYALHAAAPNAVWSGMTKLTPLFRITLGERAQPLMGEQGRAIGATIRARPELLAELKKTEWLRSRDESDLAVAFAVFGFVNEVSAQSEDPKGDPQDWHKELLAATGLFQVRSESKTWSDLKQDMENSLNKRFQEWGRAHPVETQLMQQWLQELERVRLASLK